MDDLIAGLGGKLPDSIGRWTAFACEQQLALFLQLFGDMNDDAHWFVTLAVAALTERRQYGGCKL